MAPLALIMSVPAQAQDPRLELQGWYGYTFSDGVSGDPREASDGNVYNRIEPRNSSSYGLSVGFFLTEHVEVGFLWDRQDSTLEARRNLVATDFADLEISNTHGFVAYNFSRVDDTIRPYVLGGMGATRYSNITIRGADDTREIPSESRFSTTWGAGLKIYPTAHFGIFAGVRWTPTHIKTDAAGWWCDPWWGCWVVGNAQYANQWELSGGINLRF